MYDQKIPRYCSDGASNQLMLVPIKWFCRDQLLGFSGLYGCSLKMNLPSGLWICEPKGKRSAGVKKETLQWIREKSMGV